MWLEVIKNGDISQGSELDWLIGESGELQSSDSPISQILKFSDPQIH